MLNVNFEAMKDKILKILTKNFKANHMEYQNALNELLNLHIVSGIISKIDKLEKFDFVHDGEWISREYGEDGGCVDADDLKSITDSYR